MSTWIGNGISWFYDDVAGPALYHGLDAVGLWDDISSTDTFNAMADAGDRMLDGHVISGAVEGNVALVTGTAGHVAGEALDGLGEALGIENLRDTVSGLIPDLPDFKSWEGILAMVGGGMTGLLAGNLIGGGMMSKVLLAGVGVIVGNYIKETYLDADTSEDPDVEGADIGDTQVISSAASSAFRGDNGQAGLRLAQAGIDSPAVQGRSLTMQSAPGTRLQLAA